MMVDIMYRFEWNFEGINDGKSFEQFVEDMKNEETGVNYEQAARLFYDDENGNCLIALRDQKITDRLYLMTEETFNRVKKKFWQLDRYVLKDFLDRYADKIKIIER